eukprot:TRINITY_DN1788_c0_g2_i1.p1 TRINITY_DN1788_c0_g2~~TRINITY_DN1788_c0_g2_i1.p1  ORF type:complete len:570 (-),score=78.44 TRINITY_DN1788_c0_g2_i1:173-1882(-)
MALGNALLRQFVRLLVNTFFRRVDVVGQFRVPTEGPVIVVANHANQFVDPMMVISFLGRSVRFLIAAKSMRRPIIGHAARCFNAIGVERSQDLAEKGSGTVSANKDSTTVRGEGTQFTGLTPGAKIKITADVELTVKSIKSDVECIVSTVPESFSSVSYKIFPHIDQKAVFGKVHEALKSRDFVGIFPEGGSHDRTSLLDLKPGVAIMALGAMEAGSPPVQILPCGLNYFEAYKFRSRVVVEFGQPFTVPTELVEQYRTDKRGAVQSLMKMVQDGMEAAIPAAQDYAELQAIITMRALYKPAGKVLTPEENQRLTFSFAKALRLQRETNDAKEVLRLVGIYNADLEAAGVKDRDVRLNQMAGSAICFQAVFSLLQFVILAPFAFCFIILGSPILMTAYSCALREKKTALAGSTVKIKALDVVASYKILVSLVFIPLYILFLTVMVILLAKLDWWIGFPLYFVGWPLVGYIGITVCDHFAKATSVCKTVVLRCRGGHQSLATQRIALQLLVRKLVEEVGPQIDDNFGERRVIRALSLRQDTQQLEQALAANGFDAGLVATNTLRRPLLAD